MKNKKVSTLLLLIGSYFFVFTTFSQTSSDSSATLGYSLVGEFSGVNTFSIILDQECLASSDVVYRARAHVIYHNDQTEQCYVFNGATRRNNEAIEFVLDDFNLDLDKTIFFKVIATSTACPSNITNCENRMNLCCMEEIHFDCCNCGQWEDNVLETYWLEREWQLGPNKNGIIMSYLTAPPGFLSPMQINAKEHGCQCCTY